MPGHNAADFEKGDKVNFVSRKTDDKVYAVVKKIFPKEEKVLVETYDGEELKLNADRLSKNRGRKPGSTVEKKADKDTGKKSQTFSKKSNKKEEPEQEDLTKKELREMKEALIEMAARIAIHLGEELFPDEEGEENTEGDEEDEKPAKKGGKKKPMTDEDD